MNQSNFLFDTYSDMSIRVWFNRTCIRNFCLLEYFYVVILFAGFKFHRQNLAPWSTSLTAHLQILNCFACFIIIESFPKLYCLNYQASIWLNSPHLIFVLLTTLAPIISLNANVQYIFSTTHTRMYVNIFMHIDNEFLTPHSGLRDCYTCVFFGICVHSTNFAGDGWNISSFLQIVIYGTFVLSSFEVLSGYVLGLLKLKSSLMLQ